MNLNAPKNLTNQRARAAEYIKLGWLPIPVKFMGEERLHTDWQNLRIEEKDIDRWFHDEPMNIGVRLGGDLVDRQGLTDIHMVDEDAHRLAKHFLPDTDMKIGTPSRPSSHWMYEIRDGWLVEGTQMAASGMGTLIELRGSGDFTVLPGSVDASGEAITFEEDNCYPRSFDDDDHFWATDWEYLEDCMTKLAVATVVLKRFNSPERPYLIKSAAKFLCGCGWRRIDIQNLIESVAQETGLGQGTGRDVFESFLESGRSGLVHCLGADLVDDMWSWYIKDPRL